MSIQFGKWNFEGQPPVTDYYFEKVNTILEPYGPDSGHTYSDHAARILYRAFHTTKESHSETQPHISTSGAVITWDGRLDNRAELVGDLGQPMKMDSTDVEIVAAAYERWGTSCFARFIGDWALSIWNPTHRSLVLAKDPIGTRPLFYSYDDKEVTWSTILDPLVRLSGRTFTLCDEYIAGWLFQFPEAHLTPYIGIHSVPPSSFALLRPGTHSICKYWDFDPSKRIRYKTDAEYEEHFRTVFASAVQRRLRSDRPVLAELSGGMDSSAIVCVADMLIGRGSADTPRLGTISWYDDTYDHIQPDLNELPYFTEVEERRGCAGHHINLRLLKARCNAADTLEGANMGFGAPPLSPPGTTGAELAKQYAKHMRSEGYRVTLSGIGGDDITGGTAPTPRLELQDLLANARFVRLIHRLRAWALRMNRSPFPLLWDAILGFLMPPPERNDEYAAPFSWLQLSFLFRNQDVLYPRRSRVRLFGPLASFQDSITKLDANRRFLGCCAVTSELLRDVRYPYLDRDFLEFMYAIPRDQVVGVGKRRYLMKRALLGIVPDKILNRKRTMAQMNLPKCTWTEWITPLESNRDLISSSIGIIDENRLEDALRRVQRDESIPIGSLMRALTVECWLRQLASQGVLTRFAVSQAGEMNRPPQVVNVAETVTN